MGDGCSAVDVPVSTLSGHHTRLLRDGHGGGGMEKVGGDHSSGKSSSWKSMEEPGPSARGHIGVLSGSAS